MLRIKTLKMLEIKLSVIYLNTDLCVEEDLQRLLFKGHSMRDEDTLFDYGVDMNDVIQL